MEEEEEVVEMEDVELVKEVASRFILHWNYRKFDHLPQELLDHGGHVQEIYLKENHIEALPDSFAQKLPLLTHIYLSKNNLTSLPLDWSTFSTDLSRCVQEPPHLLATL